MALGPVTVKFESNIAGLNAGAKLAETELNNLYASSKRLAEQMTAVGMTADINLNKVLRDMAAEAARTKSALEQMGATVMETGAGATTASHGFGRITQELIVLGHEASQGRFTRLGGSLVVLAEYGGQAAVQFAAMNPVIAAVGVAALATAAAVGYLVYQTYETGKAIRGLEFDAAVHGFSLMGDASKSLLESVERLGNAGPSDARAFIQPFLALGPLGEAIAAVASQYLPLFVANGKTAKEAGEELAKAFVDLKKGGADYIEKSRDLTATQKATAIGFLDAGDKASAYRYVLEIQMRTLSGVAEEQRKAAQANELATAATLAGIPGIDDFGRSQINLAASVDAQTKKMKESEEEINRWILAASRGKDAAGDLADAMINAMKVDKIGAGIKEAQGQVEQFQRALTETKDPGEIAQLNHSLEISQDHLKKLQDQAAGGLLGGNALSRIKEENRAIDEQNQGSRSSQLQKELPGFQATAANTNLPAEERKQAEQDAAATILKIRDAEFEEEKAKNDQRVTLAGRNSAEVLAIRQKEVADAVRVYGEGNKITMRAEEELARAQAQAANRGAAEAKSAAKDVLADRQAEVEGEISAVKEASQLKIDIIKDEMKLKKVTEAAGTASIIAELAKQKAAVDDLYNHWIAISGLKDAAIEKIQTRETSFDMKNAIQVEEAQTAAALKSEQAWKGFADSVAGVLNSQVNALLTGTETFATAFKNMFVMAIEEIIKNLIKLAVEMLFIKTIMPAVGGGGSGPLGTLFHALSIPGFAGGTDYVPQTGLAIVHQGERIIPASQNNAGSGVTQNHTWNITGGPNADAREIAREVGKLWNSQPSLRPAY